MSNSHRPPFPAGSAAAREAGRKGGQVSAHGRRTRAAARYPWTGTIIDLMDAAGMTGADWLPWRSFWKAVYALPMDAAELAIYQRHTKRETPPAEQVDEAWQCIGRGGGKSRNAALHAVFRAITFDQRTVAPGEEVTIPLLASDRKQAGVALGYVRGFNELSVVAPYVFRGELSQTVEYKTRVDIEVTTASKKAPRGRTSPTACCDEIAWWDDEGANPDHEILTAVKGTLGRVPGSVLLVLSNPYAPKGELFQAVEQFYGREPESVEAGVLVWNADTLSMRPSHPLRPITRAFKRDPVVAASEYGSGGFVSFRQARQALFDEDALRQCIVTDRRELAPVSGIKYVAFLDAAEGSRSGDAMTLGIAHGEGRRAVLDDETDLPGRRAVLDCVREVEPPFDPTTVLRAFTEVLHDYGCREVQGDRHAVGFVESALEGGGITFVPSPLTKSDLYAELLPLVNTGAVELLDLPSLRTQLLSLERRSVRGGRDSIDHPRGGHDDVANAAAGALTLVTGIGARQRRRAQFV